MIDDIPLIVIQEGISILIRRDVIHDLRHCGVIDFNADNTDKLPVIIYGNIIGDHAGIQILRNIRRQPDAFSGRFWHGEPDQRGSVIRVIFGNIRHLMRFKAVAI